MTMFTRRGALMGGAGMLAAPALVSQVDAQGAFNWRRFAGERIEVSLTANPRSQILIQNQREFEALTGIRVGSESIPEQQHRQKFVIASQGRPARRTPADSDGASSKDFRGKGRTRLDATLRPKVVQLP